MFVIGTEYDHYGKHHEAYLDIRIFNCGLSGRELTTPEIHIHFSTVSRAKIFKTLEEAKDFLENEFPAIFEKYRKRFPKKITLESFKIFEVKLVQVEC